MKKELSLGIVICLSLFLSMFFIPGIIAPHTETTESHDSENENKIIFSQLMKEQLAAIETLKGLWKRIQTIQEAIPKTLKGGFKGWEQGERSPLKI